MIVVTFCLMLLICNMSCSTTSSNMPTSTTMEKNTMTVSIHSHDMSASSTVEAVKAASSTPMTYSTSSSNKIMSNEVKTVSQSESMTSTAADTPIATPTPSLGSTTKMSSKDVSLVSESKTSLSSSSSSSAGNIIPTSSMKYFPSSMINSKCLRNANFDWSYSFLFLIKADNWGIVLMNKIEE